MMLAEFIWQRRRVKRDRYGAPATRLYVGFETLRELRRESDATDWGLAPGNRQMYRGLTVYTVADDPEHLEVA